jgi:16S rRNA processing protein RimM
VAKQPFDPRARKPSPLQGEGGSGRNARQEPDESANSHQDSNTSPQPASHAASLPQGEKDRRICVAQIGDAHGLRGGVHLRSFTEDPEAFARYGPLETEDGTRRLEIDTVKPGKDGFNVRFVGITRREQAETLRNINLYVDRDRLPEADEDEFYYADLIGLAAVSQQGDVLGEVIAMHNFGAGDIVELKLSSGGQTMLAFDKATVPEVDIAGGRIVVVMPDEVVVQGELTAESDEGASNSASSPPLKP